MKWKSPKVVLTYFFTSFGSASKPSTQLGTTYRLLAEMPEIVEARIGRGSRGRGNGRRGSWRRGHKTHAGNADVLFARDARIAERAWRRLRSQPSAQVRRVGLDRAHGIGEHVGNVRFRGQEVAPAAQNPVEIAGAIKRPVEILHVRHFPFINIYIE